MREYDIDERPIPLGRARVREAAGEASPAAHIEEDANVEVARPAAVRVAQRWHEVEGLVG